jgi:tetratricopeptide (TPR) repeat protein
MLCFLFYSHSFGLFSKGFFKRAQELFEKSLQVLKEIYQGQDRPEMASVIFNIAQQLLKQGAYDQALQQCSNAVNLFKKVCNFLQK